MNEELKRSLEQAKSNRKTNKKFLAGASKERGLDPAFHEAHERVFSEVDCLDCANCCKTTSPIFRDVDIDRIASHLGVRPAEFTGKNLHIDEDGDWVLNQSPCLFLLGDNKCAIYEVRPKACREYPHTDRKNMSQISDLTFRNTLVCPATARIVEMVRHKLRG